MYGYNHAHHSHHRRNHPFRLGSRHPADQPLGHPERLDGNIITNHMQTTHRQHYIAPTSEAMGLQMQLLLCTSHTETANPGFGDTWTWDE